LLEKTRSPHRIAVIGAGMTGLTAARQLTDRGFAVTVFEKSRGLGGRLATRRTIDGLTFDHGAQYVTAREDRFRSMLGDALAAKVASQWSPIVSSEEVFSPSEWMVGTATMNKLIAPIAEGIPVQRQMKVTSITRDGSDWRLGFDPGDDRQTFDAVVCTIPAPQVRPLFEGEAALLADIDGVRMAPCWALMLTFETPLDPGFDVWRSDRHNLAWFCRNASRPERNTSHESWVLHADAEWSERHLEASPEFIAAELIERLANALPLRLPAIERVMAHRWRYARTTVALGRPFLATKDQTLLFGGDWTLGARVECAYESGLAMADAVAEKLGV